MSSPQESNEEIEEKKGETSSNEEENPEEETITVDLKLPIEDAGEGTKLDADFLQKPFVLNDLECIATLTEHTQPVRWVVVNDNILYSSADDALIKVWDLDMKCCIDTWKGHQDSVCHMSLCNNRLYSASWDKTVRVWDTETGKCIHVLSGHQEVVFQVLCDGKRIYSASVDRTIRVWDDISGKCVDVWKGHKTRVLSLVFYDDKVISSSMTEILIWNKYDGKIVKEIDMPATRCMLVQGSRLYIGQDWYAWCVYDLIAEKIVVQKIEWEPVQCMSTDSDGKVYLCSSFSFNLAVWAPDEEEENTYKMVADIPAHQGPTNCILYHNGVIISASNDKTIKLWSKKTIKPATTLRGHKAEIDCLLLWGNYALTASLDGTIRKWDLSTNKCVGQFIGHEDMIYQMVCVDEYLISCSYDKQVRVWDIVECKHLWTMRHAEPVNCLAAREEYLYTTTSIGKIYKWKLSTSKLLASSGDGTIGKGKWILLHEDFIYMTSDNGLFKVSIKANEEFGTIVKSYEGSEYFSALHFIGNSLYVATEDGLLTEWDPETFVPKRAIRIHPGEDTSLVNFYALGNNIYSSGNEGLLKITDLPSGKCLYSCKLHEDGIRDMRISSDKVYTVGLDESLIVWDMTLLLNPALTRLIEKDYRAEHPNWTVEADINGRTPLMAMAAHGMLEVDEIMKEIPGISILDTNKLGESLVYFAIKNRHWNLVKLWKDRPEMKNLFTDTSNTALQSLLSFESAHDDNEFFQALWTSSGTRPSVDLLALAFIRSHPRLKLLETALNTYDMLNKKSKKNKKTLLHYCALFGAPNAVNLLLERELLKVNEEDSDRNSPLHLCFTVDEFIDHEFEEELIRKAAPNARHMIIMDRLQVAKILLQRAEDKNIHMLNRNKYGLKAYHYALKQYDQIRSELRKENTDHEAVAFKTKELQMITEVIDMFHQQPAISHYRERFAWNTFWKQAVPYAIWLVFLSLVCVHQSVARMNPSGYYLSEHVGDIVGDYGSVGDIPTFWSWVTGSLVPGLESQNWKSPDLDLNSVGGGLMLIGAAQMVQVRVPQHSCYIPSQFKPLVNNCIASGYDVDKTSYGPGGRYKYDSEAGFWFYGTSGTLYHGGGFAYTMSPDSTVSLPQITSMMNDSWVDSSTRAISISFTLYSPGLRFYGMADIVFEFSASGKVLSNLNLQTMKAFPYSEPYDYFLLALELIVILYFLKEFPYQECKEIYHDKIAYFKDIGNYMEWGISGLFIVSVILRIMSVAIIKTLNLDPATGEYVNLWNLGRIMYANQAFLAMFMLMAWIRTLKLLKILPDTGPAAISILETMKYNSFVVFILICILIVIGLTLSFHASVGMYVDSLSTFGDAFITMVRAAVFGDFDYDSISQHPTGIILYFILKLFFSTLLLTIFIAVISEIYMSLQRANEDRYNLNLTKMLVEYVNNNKKATVWKKFMTYIRPRRKPRNSDIQLLVESENVELKALDDSEVDDLEDEEHESEARKYDNEQLDELVLKFAQLRQTETE